MDQKRQNFLRFSCNSPTEPNLESGATGLSNPRVSQWPPCSRDAGQVFGTVAVPGTQWFEWKIDETMKRWKYKLICSRNPYHAKKILRGKRVFWPSCRCLWYLGHLGWADSCSRAENLRLVARTEVFPGLSRVLGLKVHPLAIWIGMVHELFADKFSIKLNTYW